MEQIKELEDHFLSGEEKKLIDKAMIEKRKGQLIDTSEVFLVYK